MDISFHYFAVKSVARAAGYTENQAQRIASFSQFVDDYNWYMYFRARNIPNYILDSKYDIVFNNFLGLVNPVTTGFIDNIDLATLIMERSQKYTVSAFHFIPQNATNVASKDYRAVPATLNDGSYIATMINKLKSDIHSGVGTEDEQLMRMGMLFHVFADTYAHQLFSGYIAKANSATITQVVNNITDNDVTEQMRFFIEKYIEKIEKNTGKKVPTIGHMAIGHLPDLTHLRFTIEYTGPDGQKHNHSRSNTSTFVLAAKELYDFMRECLENVPANMEWDILQEKLATGFLIDVADDLSNNEPQAIQRLIAHWSESFPNYVYSYDGNAIKNGFIIPSDDIEEHNLQEELKMQEEIKLALQSYLKNASEEERQILIANSLELGVFGNNYTDDFYKYNLFADELLIHLYGNHPRNRFD